MKSNGKRVFITKKESSVATPIQTTTTNYYESIHKNIPLNWTREYINNQLCLSFDSNNFYKITIPTGIYCVLTEEDKKNCNIINDDSIKLEKGKGKFIWKKTKIPLQLLYDFIRVSAQVYNKYKSEFAAAIFYDTKQDDYMLLFPKQTISGASVTYNVSEGFNEYPNKDDLIFLVDMHSHHTMPIGFSSIDDHSDSDLGTFGNISLVIKGIDKFNYTNIKNNVDIRFTIQDVSFDIDLFEVFENEDSDYEFALTKINKLDPVVTTWGKSYGYGSEWDDYEYDIAGRYNFRKANTGKYGSSHITPAHTKQDSNIEKKESVKVEPMHVTPVKTTPEDILLNEIEEVSPIPFEIKE